MNDSAIISFTTGLCEITVKVDFDVVLGEEDSRDCPGTDPSVDCVNSVEFIELNGPDGCKDQDDLGQEAVEEMARISLMVLRQGHFDNLLLENAESNDWDEEDRRSAGY